MIVPGVGAEAVGGVLGRDPALQRRAADADVLLATARGRRAVSPAAIRSWDDDEVDVGDLLGHRVLDLDARVHLDEDVLARSSVERGTRPCRR